LAVTFLLADNKYTAFTNGIQTLKLGVHAGAFTLKTKAGAFTFIFNSVFFSTICLAEIFVLILD